MQIHAIPKTYAFVMIATRKICAGEEIMVKYQEGGYYGKECLCRTCTGNNTRDMSVLKQKVDRQEAGGDQARHLELSK